MSFRKARTLSSSLYLPQMQVRSLRFEMVLPMGVTVVQSDGRESTMSANAASVVVSR